MPNFITKEALLKLGFIAQDIVESNDPLDDAIYQVFIKENFENRIEITNDLDKDHKVVNQWMDIHIEIQNIKNPKTLIGKALHLINCKDHVEIDGKARLHGIEVTDVEYVKGH